MMDTFLKLCSLAGVLLLCLLVIVVPHLLGAEGGDES